MATTQSPSFQDTSIEKVKARQKDSAILHDASRFGKLEILRSCIEEQKLDHELRDSRNRTLLHSAAMTGHLAIVKYLVETIKIDVDAKDKFQRTSLHLACKQWQLGVVRYLVHNSEVDLNCQDYVGYTPLHIAARDGQIYVMKLLLDLNLGFKKDIGSRADTTFLAQGQIANLFAVDARGDTPLHLAPDMRTAQCILENQAASIIGKLLQVKNSNGLSPLEAARENIERVTCRIKKKEKQELIYYLEAFELQPLFAYDSSQLRDKKMAMSNTYNEIVTNPRFNDFQRSFALETRRLLLATDIYEVAHSVMEFLSLKDILNS